MKVIVKVFHNKVISLKPTVSGNEDNQGEERTFSGSFCTILGFINVGRMILELLLVLDYLSSGCAA